MQIFLIMILSAFIGGYFYFDSPSFKVEHEYSKTNLASESEATCIAIQQQKAIDDNITNLYDNRHQFVQYYPCSQVYEMETRKYCLTPDSEITQDCLQQNERGEYVNSQYIVTKTKKLEGVTHSSMMKLLYNLSGGMPNIGLVFANDDGQYIILNSGKLENPVNIPPKIVGDFGVESTQLVYLNYYSPETIKSMVSNKERQKLTCKKGEIKSYDTEAKAFKCKAFNPALKCFGEMVENSFGVCVPDERYRSRKQCDAGKMVYFNEVTSAWDCKTKAVKGCDKGYSMQFDGENVTCLPIINPDSLQGCKPLETINVDTGTNKDRIKLEASGSASLCNSCEMPVYDRNTCKLTCMPNKTDIVQTKCLDARDYLRNPIIKGGNAVTAGFTISNNQISPTGCSTVSVNHNCISHVIVYWDLGGTTKWSGYDCFPLQLKSKFTDINNKDRNIVSQYNRTLIESETGHNDSDAVILYQKFWEMFTNLPKTDIDGNTLSRDKQLFYYFCETENRGTNNDICRRMGKPYFFYNINTNKCYDPLGEETMDSDVANQDEVKKALEQYKCPTGYCRTRDEVAGIVSNCLPSSTATKSPTSVVCLTASSVLECGYNQVTVLNTNGTMDCWTPPTGFPNDAYSVTRTATEFNGGPYTYYTICNDTGTGNKCVNTGNTIISHNELAFCEVVNGKCANATQYNGCRAGSIRTSGICGLVWHDTPCPYNDYFDSKQGTQGQTASTVCKANATSCKAGYVMKFVGVYNSAIKEIQAKAYCVPADNSAEPAPMGARYTQIDYNSHYYYLPTASGTLTSNTVGQTDNPAHVIELVTEEGFSKIDFGAFEKGDCNDGYVKNMTSTQKLCERNFCDGTDAVNFNKAEYKNYIVTLFKKQDSTAATCANTDGYCTNMIFGNSFPASFIDTPPSKSECVYLWRPDYSGLGSTTYTAMTTDFTVDKIKSTTNKVFLGREAADLNTASKINPRSAFKYKNFTKTSNYKVTTTEPVYTTPEPTEEEPNPQPIQTGTKTVYTDTHVVSSKKSCPSGKEGYIRLWVDATGWETNCILNWGSDYQNGSNIQTASSVYKTGWVVGYEDTTNSTPDTNITGALDVKTIRLYRPSVNEFKTVQDIANMRLQADGTANLMYNVNGKQDFPAPETYQGLKYAWNDLLSWSEDGSSSVILCTGGDTGSVLSGYLTEIKPYTIKLSDNCFDKVQPIYYANYQTEKDDLFKIKDVCNNTACQPEANKYSHYEVIAGSGFYAEWDNITGWKPTLLPRQCTTSGFSAGVLTKVADFWGLKSGTAVSTIYGSSCFSRFRPSYDLWSELRWKTLTRPQQILINYPDNMQCTDLANCTAVTDNKVYRCATDNVPSNWNTSSGWVDYKLASATEPNPLTWTATGNLNPSGTQKNYVLTKEAIASGDLKVHLCRPTKAASLLVNKKLGDYKTEFNTIAEECAFYAGLSTYDAAKCTTEGYSACTVNTYTYYGWTDENGWATTCEKNYCYAAGAKPTNKPIAYIEYSKTRVTTPIVTTDCVDLCQPAYSNPAASALEVHAVEKCNLTPVTHDNCDGFPRAREYNYSAWSDTAGWSACNKVNRCSTSLEGTTGSKYISGEYDNDNTSATNALIDTQGGKINKNATGRLQVTKCLKTCRPQFGSTTVCVETEAMYNNCSASSGYLYATWDDGYGWSTCSTINNCTDRDATATAAKWIHYSKANINTGISDYLTNKIAKDQTGSIKLDKCVTNCQPKFEAGAASKVGWITAKIEDNSISDCCNKSITAATTTDANKEACDYVRSDDDAYKYFGWVAANGWDSTSQINKCTNYTTITQVAYVDINKVDATANNTKKRVAECVTRVKPVPHLKLNGGTTCLDQGSDCEYKSTYTWTRGTSTATTYNSCKYISATEAWCKYGTEPVSRKITWTDALGWANQGFVQCTGAFTGTPSIQTPDLINDCQKTCQPAFQTGSSAPYNSTVTCNTTGDAANYPCGSSAYTYSKWLETSGWQACSNNNYCTANGLSTSINTNYIKYSKTRPTTGSSPIKTDECLDGCQPRYIYAGAGYKIETATVINGNTLNKDTRCTTNKYDGQCATSQPDSHLYSAWVDATGWGSCTDQNYCTDKSGAANFQGSHIKYTKTNNNTAAATANHVPVSMGVALCVTDCRPKYGLTTAQKTTTGANTDLCCDPTGGTSGTACSQAQDSTNIYEYHKWENNTTGWGDEYTNYCTASGSAPTFTAKYIKLQKARGSINTIPTTNCVTECRPKYSATAYSDTTIYTSTSCCNTTDTSDTTTTACNKASVNANTVSFWKTGDGWTSRDAVCEFDKDLRSTWVKPTGWKNLQASVDASGNITCTLGYDPKSANNCQYCSIKICTESPATTINQTTGDCLAAFSIQYNSGTCWKCGTPSNPICPESSYSTFVSFVLDDESGERKLTCKNASNVTKAYKIDSTGTFNYDCSNTPVSNGCPKVFEIETGISRLPNLKLKAL